LPTPSTRRPDAAGGAPSTSIQKATRGRARTLRLGLRDLEDADWVTKLASGGLEEPEYPRVRCPGGCARATESYLPRPPRIAPRRAALISMSGFIGPADGRRCGLGCMRLSTERDRDEARGIAVLHAAFDAGIALLDTADAYCWDDSERGHNERLIARALASWHGDRARVRVATKGGLIRPDGRWEPNGRAKHLMAACEASQRALGVDRIHLYQLHVPDPRTPLATSVRALAALKRDGAIEAIGLSNVTVGQIEEARRIVEIDAVQNELSLWQEAHVLSGVAEYCITHGIRLLAYRPLGGPSRRRRTSTEATLAAIAARHRDASATEATPAEIALAWLMDLSALIVPIPGATRVETVASIARAAAIVLTDEDRAQLREDFPAGRACGAPPLSPGSRLPTPSPASGPPPSSSRSPSASPQSTPASSRASAVASLPLRTDSDVAIVMGLPGAGKSTYAERLIADGYRRLNRDEAGGTLRDLLPALDEALALTTALGATRIVLDNTYVSRKSRAEVIRVASARGVPVRCIWLSTSVEDAQTNAAWRLVSRYGRLPGDAELTRLRRQDVAAFLPTVQFRYQRELEPPDIAEGFSRIERVPFERRLAPSFVHRALIVWCDDLLLRSRSGQRAPLTPDDVDAAAVKACAPIVRRYRDEGWRVLGMSWQPQIAAGTQTVAGAEAVFARMRALLGESSDGGEIDMDVAHCPHAAGPPACWCRKPLPGLGVLFIHRYALDPTRCLYVGRGPQDAGFARRLGFIHRDRLE
jgi:aryl-alcohol dehydrogenase-like predicted oxidoreductase/predicted kinase